MNKGTAMGLLCKSLLIFCVLAPSLTRADIIIDIEDVELLANTPNQTISIFVLGGERVQGINFLLQIEPDLARNIPAPRITALQLFGPNMVFSNSNTGLNNPLIGEANGYPGLQFAFATTTTRTDVDGGTVAATGLLATVTVDTTGLNAGNFVINMSNTLDGPTDFAGIEVDQFRGGNVTVTAIPEPSSVTLAILGLGVTLLRPRPRLSS